MENSFVGGVWCTFADVISSYIVLVLDFFVNTMAFGWLGKVARFFIPRNIKAEGKVFPRNVGDVLELPRGRLYPLFSGSNDISLCKGSKCRDDC